MLRPNVRLFAVLLAVAASSLGPLSQASSQETTPPQYKLYDLGPIELPIEGQADCDHIDGGIEAISSDEAIVGRKPGANNWFVPVKTDPGSTNLKKLDAPVHGASALEVNSEGIAVGFTYSEGSAGSCTGRRTNLPAYWIASELTELTTGTLTNGFASGINDSGQIVGAVLGSTGFSQPAIWTDGELQILIPLSGIAEDGGSAAAINESGDVVGSSAALDGATPQGHATLWQDGQAIDLGALDGQGSGATDISDDDLIVGVIAYPAVGDRPAHTLPVIWVEGAAKLLPLPQGFDAGSAMANKNEGVVVGRVTSDTASTAVIWFEDEVYVIDEHVEDAEGWTFQAAQDINDDGVIVGNGEIDGVQHGFKLKPQKS